ncbi:MAG: NADH-quinone oxidoreductase subunit J [Anaeromyxobacteraceae bacterium]
MKSNLGKLALWVVASALVIGFLVYMSGRALLPAIDANPQPPTGAAGLPDILFYAVAALTVGGAAAVALSRNILRSAIGLLFALLGVGGLYVMLAADFLAVAQLLIYIGGVLTLILFAVMLTNRISDVTVSNVSAGLYGGVLLFVAVVPVLLTVALVTPWRTIALPAAAYTAAPLGNALLTRWLLPFEVASLILLATLIGAIVIARKEIKAD